MRRVLLKTTLAAAIAVTLHCSAGAQTLQGQLLSGTDILAKPGIRIAYPATATVDGNELTRTSMADITLKCNGEEYVNRVVDVTDILAEDGETVAQKLISVITDDEHYLAPGATVTLEMPEIKDGDNTNLDSEGNPETFTFRVKDYLTISSFANLDDYHYDNRGIIVKSGGQLTIDNSRAVTCEQLIVESEAGVVVREGSSLSITDTAYVFSSHSLDVDRSPKNGYIYNGGKVTAGSFVFSYYFNNVYNKGGFYIAPPVSGKIFECCTLDPEAAATVKMNQYNENPLGVTGDNIRQYKLIENHKEYEVILGKSYQFGGTLFGKIIRLKGNLWDVDEYTITGTQGEFDATYNMITVPNSFPFPINMTRLKDDVTSLYEINGYVMQQSTILGTGINTKNTDFKTAQIMGQGGVGMHMNFKKTETADYEITIKKEYADLPTQTKTDETTDIKYLRLELYRPNAGIYGETLNCIVSLFYESDENYSSQEDYNKEQMFMLPYNKYNTISPLVVSDKNNVYLCIVGEKEIRLKGQGYSRITLFLPEAETIAYLKVKDTNLPDGTKVYEEDHSDVNLCETELEVDFTNGSAYTSPYYHVKYKKVEAYIYVNVPEETEEPGDPTAIGDVAQGEAVTIANTAGGISITNRTGEELLYSITDISGKIIRSGIANIGCNNVEILGRNIIFAAVTTKSGKTIKNGKFITK